MKATYHVVFLTNSRGIETEKVEADDVDKAGDTIRKKYQRRGVFVVTVVSGGDVYIPGSNGGFYQN